MDKDKQFVYATSSMAPQRVTFTQSNKPTNSKNAYFLSSSQKYSEPAIYQFKDMSHFNNTQIGQPKSVCEDKAQDSALKSSGQ